VTPTSASWSASQLPPHRAREPRGRSTRRCRRRPWVITTDRPWHLDSVVGHDHLGRRRRAHLSRPLHEANFRDLKALMKRAQHYAALICAKPRANASGFASSCPSARAADTMTFLRRASQCAPCPARSNSCHMCRGAVDLDPGIRRSWAVRRQRVDRTHRLTRSGGGATAKPTMMPIRASPIRRTTPRRSRTPHVAGLILLVVAAIRLRREADPRRSGATTMWSSMSALADDPTCSP